MIIVTVLTEMIYCRYLLKDQLKGPSSVEGFVRTLKKGCRYIERKFSEREKAGIAAVLVMMIADAGCSCWLISFSHSLHMCDSWFAVNNSKWQYCSQCANSKYMNGNNYLLIWF